MAMWPPVMFAASRIVSANGRTNMPRISIGISATARNGDTPCGTRFFQCWTKPCAFDPATMIAKKLIDGERRRSR